MEQKNQGKLSATDLITILENPEDYQSWLLHLCENEFSQRQIPPYRTKRLAIRQLRIKIRTDFHKGLLITDKEEVKYKSRFLTSELVKAIFEKAFMEYKDLQTRWNSHLR